MTRKHFQNLKGYLAENLLKYNDLNETVNYVAYNEISTEEYYKMHRSLESIYPITHVSMSNDIKNLYVVAKEYLHLEYPDLCKILLSNPQLNRNQLE